MRSDCFFKQYIYIYILLLFYFFPSPPIRSGEVFSSVIFFLSFSSFFFFFFGCSDGMEREACVCDHGFERSDLCAEIIIRHPTYAYSCSRWNFV